MVVDEENLRELVPLWKSSTLCRDRDHRPVRDWRKSAKWNDRDPLKLAISSICPSPIHLDSAPPVFVSSTFPIKFKRHR